MNLIESDISHAREIAKTAARTLKPLRTERTIRMLAKELSGLVWENPALLFELDLQTIEEQMLFNGVAIHLAEKDWPEGWRRTYHVLWPDQQIHAQLLWPRFYKAARAKLLTMLHHESSTTEHMKARIFEAICEDREKGN